MRKLRIYIVCLSSLLALSSCEDEILDLTERDRLPTSSAVASINGLQTTMLDVYVNARAIHEANDISCYKQCGTDIAMSGTNMDDVPQGGMRGMMEYSNAFDATSGIGDASGVEDVFNQLYLAIDRCNVVIAFGGETPVDNTQEEILRDQLIGEAYALRAYAYLELATRWDNAVVANLAQSVDDIVFTADLSNRDELMQLVISDLEAAIPLLRTRMETNDVGKASKEMAYLMLTKAHLWLGNWAEAASAAENVIALGAQLQPLDGIFGTVGGKTGEENNQELIFSWIFNPADQNRPQRTIQMYVPLYDRVPGVARTLEQGGRPWSRLSPTDYYWSLFEEGDGRLEAWHKLSWTVDDPDNIDTGLEGGSDLQAGDELTAESPYFLAWASNDDQIHYLDPSCSKNWEDGTYGRLESEAQGFRNVIVYRLAEAYILGAEAHLRNGNEGGALNLINTLRERAFGDASHNFSSLSMENIIEEHARELGHEGHRWGFLKRLGILVERVQMHNPSASANIQEKHTRWPIPQNFVDQLGVEQNPGY
ncbi:RagB/SusD family nutrient uptake outer membrane protein [Mangrovimonas sp. TPBH4]|uniref:RagB/SusD family nutrient uptake outer membrane protein n=1 Tax=Mangrovimonas sp. TPBH4 TaxID=1645914 RepID=UPI0009EB83AD|nr:RagB/SusD family nutrient uptake outer membrane protein [Mangrovimonas sp. TPBH4]